MGLVDMKEDVLSQPPSGKVMWFQRNWKAITSDQWILNCVQGYEIEWVARPSQICTPRKLVFPKAEADCLSAEIESLLQKDAISPICPPFDETTSEHGFVSQLFAVPKKDGGIRPVVNLKALNSHVQQVPFKMEGIHILKDILRPGDWMTKIDLKDAYFSIPVSSHDRKFLRFRWQGKMYQFNCLPFGLSSAPWIFTKATKPVVTILRTLGMRIIIYIDDILVMAPSKELAQEHTECLIFLLDNLGFTVNRQKSLTDPTQEIDLLGLVADSVLMELRLPGSQIKNIRSDAKALLQMVQPTAREVSRLLGKLTHATHAMRAAPLFFRHLQACLQAALQPLQDYSQHCPLTKEAKEDLNWWATHPTSWNGKSIIRGNPDLTIETDASNIGWGARCGSLQTGGPWSPTEARMHINCLELLAATLAIQAFAKKQENILAHLKMDSTFALKYINKMGGTVSPPPPPPPRPQSAHQGSLDLVPSQEHHPQGLSPSRCSQREGRRGVQDHERSFRVDALQGNIQENSNTVWTPGHRFVCVETDETTSDLCQLAARPTGSGDRRVLEELERSEGIRQPLLALDHSSFMSSQGTSGNHCAGGAGVENPSYVFPTVGDADRDTPQTSQDKEPDSANTPSQLPRHTTPPSRVAYLRARFSAERIAPQASSLLLASWRETSGRMYDSLFGKWASWCVERDIDPISGDITGVVNFLADLFHQGYQHRSLCSYRSAISSVHEKVDGQPIGSHPMVSRLLEGAFHERPPQPRYSATWDISVVANHILSLGDNQNLAFADLTLKLVMLLALTRPSRSIDLTNLDIRFRHYSPEGVTFQSAKLAKQSRQTKPVRDFFFPKFEQNKKLCPVLTLQEYEKRTTDKRSPHGSTHLLIAMIRPHKLVSSSTVERWLKTVLNNAGIDTSIFKAHSVRSAACSSASEVGVTTATILDAADWATETVFQRFYYKPKHNTTFRHAVLTQLSTTGNKATKSR